MNECAVDAVGDGIEVCVTDQAAVEGRVPDPIIRQNDQLAGEHHEAHQVEVRLVVAKDDGGPTEILARGVFHRGADLREMLHRKTGHAVKHVVIGGLFLLRRLAQGEHDPPHEGQSETCEEEIGKRIKAHEQIAQCDGHAAWPAARGGQEAEEERREEVGHHHDGEHAHHRDLAQGAQRRVACEDHDAHADKHDGGREGDAVFVGGQRSASVGVFVNQPLGHEDGVVVALAEDERGQDDVDDVELHVEDAHQPKNPDPAERQRDKGDEAKLDPPHGEEQEDEDDEAADVEHIVEVVRQGSDHAARHRLGVEGDGGLASLVERLLDGRRAIGV